MKVIPLSAALDRIPEIAAVLAEGKVASFPVGGAYRLAADARSADAVNRLFQVKRRAKSHPALILVPNLAAAKPFVDGAAWPITRRLAERLWPSALTIVLPPSEHLDPDIRRPLTRATGKVGVRVPHEPLSSQILKAFNAPILLSSANLEHKPGANSASALRQRFAHTVDVWVDAGDIPPAAPSTLVELGPDSFKILREGAVARAAIESALERLLPTP